VNLKGLLPGMNIAPTESINLVRRRAFDGAELTSARWWLTPHWAKDLSQKYAMFNARCEGLSNSPAFRKPFASQRGIVPMSSFIEWRGGTGNKQPWLISNEQQAIAVAALWEVWSGAGEDPPLLSCTLVTTAAAQVFKPWHSRMPVMLAPPDRERWLDNSRAIPLDDPLFSPRLHEPLRLLPIDRAVGNARNKSPELMQAVGDEIVLRADRG
jgi:putative SOS response-associated peptidase YedK